MNVYDPPEAQIVTRLHDAEREVDRLRDRVAEADRKVGWMAEETKQATDRLAEANAKLRLVEAEPGAAWFWQGDGGDDPASLSCPVIMTAETLRGFVAAEARVAELEGELAEERRARDEARAWVRRLTAKERVLTCAFCGEAYPPGTPESNDDALTAHVKVCPKHPMREAERELAAVDAALRGEPVPPDASERVRALAELATLPRFVRRPAPFRAPVHERVYVETADDDATAAPPDEGDGLTGGAAAPSAGLIRTARDAAERMIDEGRRLEREGQRALREAIAAEQRRAAADARQYRDEDEGDGLTAECACNSLGLRDDPSDHDCACPVHRGCRSCERRPDDGLDAGKRAAVNHLRAAGVMPRRAR